MKHDTAGLSEFGCFFAENCHCSVKNARNTGLCLVNISGKDDYPANPSESRIPTPKHQEGTFE